ncbi:MAG: carboxylesterase family protein, partial [Selenomonadaceae bacterium]|nr:carboxylesterase family protein [Selenomonadaceae bacterium]
MADLTRRDFIKLTSAAALAMSLPINAFAADNCSVKTKYGTFNGFVDKQGVKTWLGIPYAQPPVGKLRWQAPEPLKPTNKTFEAKKFGFRAVQIDDGEEGSSTIPQS